jgi:hypothetical protein
MKHIFSLAFLMVLAISGTFAKDRASAHTTVKGDFISVTYGQPNMKGREIFGGLVPYGQVWRTGADEATEITITKGCMFGGKQVSPGTYTLFTIPEKGQWTIILNSKLKQWGAFEYDQVKDKNVLVAKVPSKQLDNAVETFTIKVADNGITLSWDKTSVFVSAQL